MKQVKLIMTGTAGGLVTLVMAWLIIGRLAPISESLWVVYAILIATFVIGFVATTVVCFKFGWIESRMLAWCAVAVNLVIVSAYYGLLFYSYSQCDIGLLMVDTREHTEMYRASFPKWIPEWYIFKFRGTKEDIETLEAGIGISMCFSPEDDLTQEDIKYAQFFLDKGIDINAIGNDGLTAMHRAVINNEPRELAWLISKGADADIKAVEGQYTNKFAGKNALDIAQYVAEKSKLKPDLTEIKDILNNRKQ